MKFQKDNTKNRLTAEIITKRKENAENKRKVEEEKQKEQEQLKAKYIEELKRRAKEREPYVNRIAAYPEITHQLDMLWHDMDSGIIKVDKRKANTWYQMIKTVKKENPLPTK